MNGETLDEFMARKHDPKFKPRRQVVPKLALPKISRTESAQLWRGHDVHHSMDYRTILEPVSLDEFIARKSVPGFKAPPIPPAPGVPRPTPKMVTASIRAWNDMVAESGRRRRAIDAHRDSVDRGWAS